MGIDTFAGKSALITGGASGIGLATGQMLVERGCRVVLADLTDESGEVAALTIGATFVHLDVSRSEDWAALVAAHPTFDIVHLNAGVSTLWPSGPKPDPGAVRLLDLSDQAIRRVVGVNIEGVVFGVRAMLPVLGNRGGGVIVATSSLAGVSGLAPDPLYSLSKHAVVGLVRSLAPTLAPLGINIHAVCPGVTDTGMLDDGSRHELLEVGFPLMSAERVAEAVLAAAQSELSGQVWICQPGRETLAFRFHRIPAARLDDGTPAVPGGALSD